MLAITNGITPEGKSISYYYAEDEDGNEIDQKTLIKNQSKYDDKRNVNFGSGQSEDDIAISAKQLYENVKGKGFTGTFTTFGAPKIKHGDVIEMRLNTSRTENENILEKQYMVASVDTTFTMNGGIRQKITLDQQVN